MLREVLLIVLLAAVGRPEGLVRAEAGFEAGGAVEAEAAGGADRDAWEVPGKGEWQPPAEMVRRAAEARREALERLAATLGLRPGDVPIRWVLHGSISPGGPPGQGRDGPAGFKAGATSLDDAARITVRVHAARFLRDPEGLAATIAHEAAHAGLRAALGSEERNRAVPEWFREGLALWFAEEGDLRVAERVALTVFEGGGADSFLRGIPLGSEVPAGGAALAAPTTEAEDYLAVCWIVERGGTPALRSICRSLADGGILDASLEAALGVPPLRAREGMLRFAIDRVRGILPPAREMVFRASIEDRGAGRMGSAERAWKRLLLEAPEGPLAGTLEYLLGEALARRPSERDEARRRLESLLRRRTTLWRPEALVLLGEILRDEGRVEEARALWREALDSFGEDRMAAPRARSNLRATAETR